MIAPVGIDDVQNNSLSGESNVKFNAVRQLILLKSLLKAGKVKSTK